METTNSINKKSRELLQELCNLSPVSDFDQTSQLLDQFKILTREKTLDIDTLDKSCISLLVNCSTECHTEAQKCLSNLILNYTHIRNQLIEPYVNCVEERLKIILNDQNNLPKALVSRKDRCEVLYHDLRIIFLLSALCLTSRSLIRDRLADLLFDLTLKESDEFSPENYLLVVEGLKTLFNLTMDKYINKPLAAKVIRKLFSIVGTDKDVSNDPETRTKLDLTQPDQLLVNLVHLLTNMPEEVYLELTDEDVNKILSHLDTRLLTYSKHNFRDTILPILNVCANICKYNDVVRKRWFDKILGSEKEFEKRPEEYETLRGRLVKLMTSVDVHIKDIAADFMYALCGGDTEKFIMYTGFGNSAAFLSSRGLLTNNFKRTTSEDAPIDGSTDYQQLRNRIDPITGKLDVIKKNPMEGMTEEEKEYHANELADAITRLTNLGIVKPMSVNEDGVVQDLHPECSDKKD